MMLHNLQAEMARNEIRRQDLANALGITVRTLQNKIYGRTDFTIAEAVKIKEAFFPDKSLKYLFEKDA